MCMTIDKANGRYTISINGEPISQCFYNDRFIDRRIDNSFEWVFIYQVFTDKVLRRNGYAKILIDELYNDIIEKYDGSIGLFVFVHPDNKPAVELFEKCGFEKVKNITEKDVIDGQLFTYELQLMAKGDKNKYNQFDNEFINKIR